MNENENEDVKNILLAEKKKCKTDANLAMIQGSVGPKKYNIFEWSAIFKGPGKTPYEDGWFKLKIDIPKNYPKSRPTVQFITPVLHPNISKDGKSICVTSLNDWKETRDIAEVVFSIFSMLAFPCFEHGLNNDAIKSHKENSVKYEEEVRNFTKKNAII